MARDEGLMLARWVNYYAAAVGTDNVLVLDDHSVDGSTDDLGCTVFHLPELPGYGEYERARTGLASGIAAGLLNVYDYVIFADVDEFLIPDPDRYADLKQFLAARPDRDVIAPVALNVVHHVGVEPDIDPERPVLDQREFAKFVPKMCKPAIKRIPAPWGYASHGIDAPYEVDPALFLIHLKFHDREALRRIADRRQAQVKVDNRAKLSSWAMSGDEISALLTEFVGDDVHSVPELTIDNLRLERVVKQMPDGYYRSAGLRQVTAMRKRPLVRIPKQLRGIV